MYGSLPLGFTSPVTTRAMAEIPPTPLKDEETIAFASTKSVGST